MRAPLLHECCTPAPSRSVDGPNESGRQQTRFRPKPSTSPITPDAKSLISVPNRRYRRRIRTPTGPFPSRFIDQPDDPTRSVPNRRDHRQPRTQTASAPSRSVDGPDNPGRKQARLRPEPSTPPANPDAKTPVPVLNHRPARQPRTQTAHRRRQHHLSAPPCAYGAVNVGAVSSRIGSHDAWLVSGYMSSIMLMALSPMISRT